MDPEIRFKIFKQLSWPYFWSWRYKIWVKYTAFQADSKSKKYNFWWISQILEFYYKIALKLIDLHTYVQYMPRGALITHKWCCCCSLFGSKMCLLGCHMYCPSNQFEICLTDVWKLIKLAEPDTFKKITISLYKFCTFSSKITARRVV